MLPRASLKSHALDCLVPDKKRYSDDWAKAGVPDHLSMRDAQSTPNKNGGSRDNFTACLGCKSSVEVNMGWHQKNAIPRGRHSRYHALGLQVGSSTGSKALVRK